MASKRMLMTLVTITMLLPLWTQAANDPAAASQCWHDWRRNQDAYPLAAWAYFQRFDGTKQEYQIYADANLNLVTAPEGQYDNAVAAGLDVLVGGWEKLHINHDRIGFWINYARQGHDKVVGYQLMDEPKPNSFAGLEKALQIIYENDKRPTLPIIDVLPNYAWQRHSRRVERFGLHYDDYMRVYTRDICPPVLLNCHYPTLKDGADRPEYYPNLETFRKHALEDNIGLMGFVLVNPHWEYRVQSESDLYWQVYCHLAYGAQGIWYYNWRIKPVSGFGEGLVTYADNEPTDVYWLAQKINREVLAIGDVLMHLKSVNVFHTGSTTPPGTTRFPNVKDSGSSALDLFHGDDFIIGEFVNQDDAADTSAYALIVNKRHGQDLAASDASLQASAAFMPARCFAYAYAYNNETGQLQALDTVSHNGQNGYYQVELGGGQGVLVRLSKTPLLGETSVRESYDHTTAVFARGKMTMDAKLDEAVWRATPTNQLVVAGENSDRKPQEAAQVQVGWHDHHFYVAGRFDDRDVLAQGQKDNDPHYKMGDVMEVFVKPEFSDWYWEIWLTPHGKCTSTFWPSWKKPATGAEQSYSLVMDYAATVDGSLNDSSDKDTGWTCELDIEFDEFTQHGKLHPQGKWLVLLARQNYTGQVDSDHRELSSFPRLSKRDFHTHDEYNLLNLVLRVE